MAAIDYTAISSSVVVKSGSINKPQCVNISIIDDSVLEHNKSFTVVITSQDPSVLIRINVIEVIIKDNDGENTDLYVSIAHALLHLSRV